MASILPNTAGPNAQLAGIQASVPRPVPTSSPTHADGGHFTIAPIFEATLGGENGGIVSPLATAPPLAGPTIGATSANGSSAVAGGPGVVVGGGTAPAVGAQPPAPGASSVAGPGVAATTVANAAAPTTMPTSAPTTMPTSAPAANSTGPSSVAPSNTDRTAQALSGFAKAQRAQPMKASVNGAEFGFPSFQTSAKSTAAPAITWGAGWKRVDANGMWYMQHTNGTKAIPAVEFRVTPAPADKVSTVKVANGWGKKFPDGTVVVFDRTEGAYRLDAKGAKHKVPLGTHTFGGVKVRVFEASVVRTLESSGAVTVFDSRGNHGAGTTRGRMAGALSGANAGASITGGGKAALDSGPAGKPVTASGPGGKPGSLVAAGGTTPTTGQLTADVQRLTGVARGLLDQVRSGNVDAAGLASLQAQLGALPAGILQAAGAAGTISSDGRILRHAGEDHTTPKPAPAAAVPAAVAAPPAAVPAAGVVPAAGTMPPVVGPTIVAASPGALVTGAGTPASAAVANTSGGGAPIAGVDANAATKQAAAGTKARLGIEVPGDMVGKQARFAQLPGEVQEAIARALGSTEGAGALKADQLVAFSSDGQVSLVESGSIFVKHVPQIRGAGPGEDLAMTVRPTRQPGSTGSFGSVSSASDAPVGPAVGGGTSGAMTSAASGASSVRPAAPAPASAPATAPSGPVVGGLVANTSSRISVFRSGQSVRSVDLGGVNGSFTWATLPAKAKNAIVDFLTTQTSDPAAKAYASRAGSGWTFDPNAVIVVDAGFASFVSGMALTRTASTSGGGAPAAPSIGPGSAASGHDGVRPPVLGGGGIGTVPPGTPPPVPAIADPGAHGGAHAPRTPGVRT